MKRNKKKMRGDRVKITTGTLQDGDPNALVFVYGIKMDQNGTPLRSFDGAIQVESLGGVKNNSTGVVMGGPEKVHRSQLRDHSMPAGLGTNDFVMMVPVMLDYYQQLGWFPTENVRVMAGGVMR